MTHNEVEPHCEHSPNRRKNTMCGITAYITKTPTPEQPLLLVEMLRTLKYRGYDSAGAAYLVPNEPVRFYKYANGHDGVPHAGSPEALVSRIASEAISADRGIAHTRWATHGTVETRNTHPHVSYDGTIAVVHNGMLENFAELKQHLAQRGIVCTSETDTEVIAHCIAEAYAQRDHDEDLYAVVEKVLSRLAGTYGLVVMSTNTADPLVAVSYGSPLVYAHDGDTTYIASESVALCGVAKTFTRVPHTSLAALYADGRMHTSASHEAESAVPSVHNTAGGGCAMLAEIREQPVTLANALRGRADEHGVHLGALDELLTRHIYTAEGEPETVQVRTVRELLEKSDLRITLVAQGTSYYAARLGALLCARVSGIAAEAVYAKEYQTRTRRYGHELCILFSQSGETADTRDALRHAKTLGAVTFGMTNRVGSIIASESDCGVHLHAGVETAVASTKAFTAQGVCMALLALELGRAQHSMTRNDYVRLVHEVLRVPTYVEEVLTTAEQDAHREALVLPNDATACAFLGAGETFALAGEAALKVQEVAYVHAHALHTSELKHGPLALVTPEFPVFAFVPSDGTEAHVGNALQIAHARGAAIYTIGHAVPSAVRGLVTHHFPMPLVAPEVFPIVAAPWVQLLSAKTALARGHNPDTPRNLAKSVTV